tara:strand:+ start:943 stop:1128 length:186 start_codon:yes stop_codon:yes gene_type:complete
VAVVVIVNILLLVGQQVMEVVALELVTLQVIRVELLELQIQVAGAGAVILLIQEMGDQVLL